MGCEGYDPCGDSMEPATLHRIEAGRGFGFLKRMDNSTFLASFSALTVLYAAAWIVLSRLMRARAAVTCDSDRMPD